MAILSSQPTKIHPLLPSFPVDFNHKNGQKSLWKYKGFVKASGLFPICYMAPLSCKSLQSKHGIVKRSIRRNGQNFETIVRSYISRAVGFSTHQFKAILTRFSDSSAKKSSSLGDVRCYNGRTYSNGPISNEHSGGSGKGGGGGNGRGSSEGGESFDGRPVLGADWWRWRCQRRTPTNTDDKLVRITVANEPQFYDEATDRWLWIMEMMVRASPTLVITLTEAESVVDFIMQALLLPFALFRMLSYIKSPEFENQLIQLSLVLIAAVPLSVAMLLWLIWRLWMDRRKGLDGGRDREQHEDDEHDIQ